MNRPKILIAGGGYADIPLILAARKLGYHVITSGNRPDELGHRYSDAYRHADFSDPDAIAEIAASEGVSALCACCNDFSALSCAYVAEKLGLPGHDPYEVSKTLHHKDRYREFARKNDIPTPRAIGARSIDEGVEAITKLHLPVIVKPVDLTGGKGVSTIREEGQASSAIEKALRISRTRRVIIEEYLEGSRHGFSAFLRDGQVVFSFSDDEYYYLNPYLVSAASAPGQVSDDVVRRLRRLSERIAALLSLKTGVFHVQYILHEDRPVIIEICRRAPGDLYVRLVEIATGVEYAEWIVRAAAGLECGGLVHAEPAGFFTRHCVMPASAGVLRDVVFHPDLEQKIVEKLMWWTPGIEVKDVLTTKFGIVFLSFASQDEMVRTTCCLNEWIRCRIDARSIPAVG